jgi:hypothetical protein
MSYNKNNELLSRKYRRCVMELGLKAINKKLGKANRMLTQAQILACIGSWEMDLSGGRIYGSDEARSICGIQTEKACLPYEEFKGKYFTFLPMMKLRGFRTA